MSGDDNWWSEEQSWDHYGARMVGHEEAIESLFSRFSEFAMERVGVDPGAVALDIGCGSGQTSIELARRVGAGGAVVGVDISDIMLERARQRAAAARVGNLSFTRSNAERDPLPRDDFDLVFSRFGVMFFDDPVLAFARIREAMNPGGKLCFISWQGIRHNTWIDLHLATIAALVGVDIRPPLDAPTGPFAFGDPARPRQILGDAGFVDVEITPFTPAVPIFGIADLDDFVEFTFTQLHAWIAMKERDAPITDEIRAALRRAYAPYHTDRGVVMQSATWVVTARAGE